MRSTRSLGPREILKLVPLSIAAMFILVAGECEDDETTAPESGPGTIRIVLDHSVAGEALVQNEMNYTTAEGNDFQVNTLVWVLSRLEIGSAGARGGTTVEGPLVHLRDAFADGSRVIEITGVPQGTYSTVTFDFGLDEVLNDPDSTYTQAGFENAWIDMNWPVTWGDGYHYMKLEGRFMPESAPRGNPPFATHLGRRYAQEDPTFGTDEAPMHHFFGVSLPIDVTVGPGETWEIPIVMDVAEWYTNPNDIDLDDTSQAIMIMMNTAVQNLFEANGVSVFSAGTPALVE